MSKWVTALAVAGLLGILGCVIIPSKHEITAHITVDIRHIEQQAESIVDFIEGKTDTLAPAEESPSGAQGSSLLWGTWDMLNPFPTAYAAESLKQDSPRVRELAEKLRQRRPKVEELMTKEYVGENNRGYLQVRSHDDLKDPEQKNAVEKIVGEENTDRKELYREVVRLNQDSNATLAIVERVFAQTYLMRAKPGQHYQLPPEGQDLDNFKKSPTGQKLADKVQPQAWVRIPE